MHRPSSLLFSSPLFEAETTEAFEHCLGLVLSHPGHVATLQTLSKIIANICARPSEPKYRQIKLGSTRIQEELVSVSGALEFLQACGMEASEDGG